MKFILVTKALGQDGPTALNVNNIVSIDAIDHEYTRIHMTNGNFFDVKEMASDILSAIDARRITVELE